MLFGDDKTMFKLINYEFYVIKTINTFLKNKIWILKHLKYNTKLTTLKLTTHTKCPMFGK